ncbi:hypothetical protein ACFQL1_06860 [Halomicroarcula sp. GCM10025709]|uniref:hypothetical protein n=1 Tax=Halomicroarcula sp. GCM10025709 TaxID=3252669 RepID=UPI0036068C62
MTFDEQNNTAQIRLANSTSADTVSVKALNSSDVTSTAQASTDRVLELNLSQAGDEILVNATVDGETTTVHREQYPPAQRVVESVTFEQSSDSTEVDSATVTFTGNQTGDRIVVRSTVRGVENTINTVETAAYAAVSINPEGDEVVVTIFDDGEATVVHRERYYPE